MHGKLLLAAFFFSSAVMAEQSQLDQHVKCPASSDKAYRVLFVGDSITRHAFNKDTIRELGWSHTSGMGASSSKTDYSNLLTAMIAKDRNQYVVKCYHTYGGSGSVADRVAGLPMVADTKPNLVVLQLGEHDNATKDPVLFHRQYATLVRQARAMSSKPKVIALGPWSMAPLDANGKYTDETAAVDHEMYIVALEESLQYMSVMDFAAIPEASGWGTSAGVKWHPNDLGHAMYAARLFRLYKAVEQ
ncbi:SGNH/GDSL hydrolase family protein [Pseudomonas sp. B22129]|uniref:SGNH/GDSL hydrolase family protein n=1 Tax=Pseudomonas sp. B22129 TaxID=3235111 RepID=UPI0037840D84